MSKDFRGLFKKLLYNQLPTHWQKRLFRYVVLYRHGWLVQNFKALMQRVFLGRNKIKDFAKFEQKALSQHGEDGLIKTIFNKIGTTNKFCVEFGVHLNEGNTLYLKSKGWDCLWMDAQGDGEVIKKEFITAENINQLFIKYNVPNEFDLLSIDIDFNDYWVWKAIEGYSPRVVIVEYNASVAVTESKAVPYDPNDYWAGDDYFGASLLALVNLGKTKGYTLITCDTSGANAFFVRNDLIQDNFEIRSIVEIYNKPGYGEKINNEYVGHPKSGKHMIPV